MYDAQRCYRSSIFVKDDNIVLVRYQFKCALDSATPPGKIGVGQFIHLLVNTQPQVRASPRIVFRNIALNILKVVEVAATAQYWLHAPSLCALLLARIRSHSSAL